jgi:hypothetical protein
MMVHLIAVELLEKVQNQYIVGMIGIIFQAGVMFGKTLDTDVSVGTPIGHK